MIEGAYRVLNANWTLLTKAQSMWRVTDAKENRVWTFKTIVPFNYTGAEPHAIARPTQMSTRGYVWNYNYDATGVLLSIVDSYTPTRRLKSAQGYYGTLGWTYDANGNRLSETANGVTSTYAYPTTSNRLSAVTPAGQSARTFTYDASGDIVTDSRTGALGMSFEYDAEGRLSRAWQTNAPSQGATYGYDAMNRLVSRRATNGSTTTTMLYVHDINDHIIAEMDAAGVTKREYVWLDDLPIAVVDGADTASPALYFVHTDHLKRPARMVNINWSWVWDVIYSPFGSVSYLWDATAKLDMRFPGQWFQMESGLAYNWHRHYDATPGRYVQPDPMGLTAFLSDGPNAYLYVGGNPLAKKDPTGHIILPPDPSGLPPGWVRDPTHRDPNGSRWRSPGGGCLDFHPGRPGASGHGGKDHWPTATGQRIQSSARNIAIRERIVLSPTMTPRLLFHKTRSRIRSGTCPGGFH
ncbi:RHS repeat domain-containing protein [Methylocystis sp. JAN1]|uniref:RHS repeat domain-containing protein n=1 Tax=Methylocystis sp. JAN1 TaxID=3397211 RepID=UPI003FA2097D